MPKKTKKEKLLAEHRRNSVREEISKSSSIQPSQRNVVQKTTIDGSYHFMSKTMNSVSMPTSFETNELHAIRRDLFKTLALSLIAFAGELALYWHWELRP